MRSPTVIIAPDSYKGSAEAADVAAALAAGLAHSCPDATITEAPMADGGEGTLACIAAARPGRWQHASVEAIHGERVTAPWYRTETGLGAIESARVLGLPLIERSDRAPGLVDRGSGALGRLIRAALDAGVREIAVGLGGSACNDAGLGLLLALGARARDAGGRDVAPTLAGLLALDTLSLDDIDPRLADTRLRVLCDVDNPLLGATGASRVYGPQKGLTAAEIDAVEQAFARLAGATGARADVDAPGSGAAGGLGFALAALGATLEPGADTLIELTGLKRQMAAADLVITGEGRSDAQTLSGKLPLAIARAAAPVPTALLSGAIADDARDALEGAFAGCYTLVERAGSTEAALADPLYWIRTVAAQIGHDIDRLRARG